MTVGRERGFTAVQSAGGLIPAEMLERIASGKDVPGCTPADYGVVGVRTVRDEAERHWDYLKSAWRELRRELPPERDAEVAPDARGLAVTRWLEPLFVELGFGRLSAVGPAGLISDDGEKHFAVSHQWNHVPVHLIGWDTALDRRSGAARSVPAQSLVQECLNRSRSRLWAVVTNGRQLRLLRDSSAFATAAYVEFDLEAIFDGELVSDFVLLFRLLHVSRFAVDEGEPASSCWLERWRLAAIESGMRALEQYQDRVQQALIALGTGFLQYPGNAAALRAVGNEALRTALLRLVYRLIFLFVVEDRDLLHAPDAAPAARERYRRYFSTERLRAQARRRRGSAHTDLYRMLSLVLTALGDENGRPELGLPGLGGLFDEREADAPLRGLVLSNRYLLDAVRALARVWDADSGRWRAVDYRNMDAEELGSVYESLLELVPKRTSGNAFELVNRLGNDRKKTGSFYTPTGLIEPLLDATLDPVIDAAQQRGLEQARAAGADDPAPAMVTELLALTVCDPACGSGHFLVAAARRIAKRVAAVRENNPEPTPPAVRHALHEVIGRCVYGVDLNPMAVDLAKVSLWLEAMEPGMPLGFLDAHLKHGNGLIGATPAALRAGVPDAAFKPVEGDDPKVARSWEQLNRKAHEGQGGLWDVETEPKVGNTVFAAEVRRITGAPAAKLAQVRCQEAAYAAWGSSADYQHALHLADAWCAAFLWHKVPGAALPITQDVFLALHDRHAHAAPQTTHDEIHRLRDEYRFFHWHLEFPEIFTVPDEGSRADADPLTGWSGGFSCVLGNPPWDKVDFEDKKYFSVAEPSIAALAGTERKTRIDAWVRDFPNEGAEYHAVRRRVKSTFLFAGKSGLFPRCADGLRVKGVNSLQTDQLFVERFTAIADPRGRVGCIVPTAIATGAGAQYLFRSLTERGAIVAILDFENRKKLFEGVDSRQKFCLLSLVGRELREPVARLTFFLLDPVELDDNRNLLTLAADEIALLNPNTGTLPIFRSRRDADLTLGIHRRIPVLWDENDRSGNRWGIVFTRLFDMTDDSDLFHKAERLTAEGWALDGDVFVRDGDRMLPLYEGKMIHHYDHRWNTFYGTGGDDRQRLEPEEKADPGMVALPRYWIADAGDVTVVRKGRELQVPGVTRRLEQLGWDREWLYGWRDVCRTTDERTAIPALIPRAAVGHKFPLMFPSVEPRLCAVLTAIQSSLVFDYVSRQKIGGISMGIFVWKQLPVPTPDVTIPHLPFLVPRIVELVYTTYDMSPLAVDLGDEPGAGPFRWDDDRRARIRAELDAYFFLLYGIDRDDTDYILETFRSDSGGGLKNNEIAKYGTYRTKDLVLAAYDHMSPAGVDLTHPLVDGDTYRCPLDPPPGHGPRHPRQDTTVETTGE